MKRLDWNQMIIGLDKLMLHGDIHNQQDAERQAALIETYLAGLGWTWDDVLKGMSDEKAHNVSTGVSDPLLS